MKTEASKESKNVYRTVRSVFDVRPKDKPPAPAGAFEKILQEERRDGRRAASRRDEPALAPAEEASSTASDDGLEIGADERPREGDQDGGGQTGADSGDADGQPSSGQNLAAPSVSAQPRREAAPPARAILHVADLERIVATIRTETFRTHKQVTIALRESVLKGLEIRLSLDKSGRITAELASSDPGVRRKLRERRDELRGILSARNQNVKEIEIVDGL